MAFEGASPGHGQGRFRLSARLQPAARPVLGAEAAVLKLDASFAPKGGTATCPIPGAIFSDGYE